MINDNRWKELVKFRKVCSCGHVILFKKQTKRIICTWCGNWCYQNKIDEFKDKLKLESRKINVKKN